MLYCSHVFMLGTLAATCCVSAVPILPEIEPVFARWSPEGKRNADGTVDFQAEDDLDVPVSPCGNCVPNGSFEQGLSGWSYGFFGREWRIIADEGGPFEEVVRGGRFGAYALKFRKLPHPDRWGRYEHIFSPAISLQTGVVHTVSLWAKGPKGAWVEVAVPAASRHFGETTGGILRVEATSEWRCYETTFVPSPGGIQVRLTGGADVLVDGVCVERGGKAAETPRFMPVEGNLVTVDPFNRLEPGKPMKVQLELATDGPVKGSVRVAVRNFYRETVYERTFDFACTKGGCASIDLGSDAVGFGPGTYVFRSEYTVDGVTWTAPYQRFTVMEPLDEKQATAHFHGVFPAHETTSRGEDNAKLMVAAGLQGVCWAKNIYYNEGMTADLRRKYGIRNRLHTLYSELENRYPEEFGWRKPQFGTYTNVSPEQIAFIEKEAYLAGKACDAQDVRWALFNEEEMNQPLVMQERYDDWFEYQYACWQGLKRAFDERRLKLEYAPSHGTSMYMVGHPGRKALEGYLKAAAKRGFRYDFIAVHTYNGLDGTSFGSSERTEYFPHIKSLLRKYGYPENTPVEFSEGFNVLPFVIRSWKADGGDSYGVEGPTLAAGQREFVHAAAIARMHIMDLKYYPRLDFTHAWQSRLTMDARMSQRGWVKAINTLGHLLPDPRFVDEVVNTNEHWRAYVFQQGDHVVTAVWACDPEVDLGLKKAPVLKLRLPEDARFFDLMGMERRARTAAEGRLAIPLTAAPMFIVTREDEFAKATLRCASCAWSTEKVNVKQGNHPAI